MQSKQLWTLICIVAIFACDSTKIFNRYTSIIDGWQRSKPVTFNFKANDTLQHYNMFLKLRANQEFEYSNIFLIAELFYPSGKITKDTLEYAMADPSGTLLGTGFAVKESVLWYKGYNKPFKFSEIGNYKLSVTNAMRPYDTVQADEKLEGIMDVGFCIENTQ